MTWLSFYISMSAITRHKRRVSRKPVYVRRRVVYKELDEMQP